MPDREPDPFWWREAAPPRRVEGGIQIAGGRGAVARTWWSGRFLAVLEEQGVGGRLARGRSYARAGQIVSLDVAAGAVTAQVQGSRAEPYRVRLGVPTYGKAEWAAVTGRLAEDASYAAALLGGEMPRGIEDVFAAAGLALFPTELVMDCTCPDRTVPCKHLAAVCYVLAERFDADPFRILALRGRDREELLAELRERRAAPEAADAPEGWFDAGPVERVTGPVLPPDALLDQVPEFPLSLRGHGITALLRPAYLAMADDAP